jgi:hypothetical protein
MSARDWFSAQTAIVETAERQLRLALLQGRGVAEARMALTIAKNQREQALVAVRASRGESSRYAGRSN